MHSLQAAFGKNQVCARKAGTIAEPVTVVKRIVCCTCVLLYTMRQSEQRGDATKGQYGGHQQCGVSALLC